jgi:hypothetical protein
MADLADARDESVINIRKDIDRGARSGLDLLLKILTPKTPEAEQADIKTKVKVAQDLLDRQGDAPKISRAQQQGRHLHVLLTPDKIEELNKRAGVLDISEAQAAAPSPASRAPDVTEIPQDLLEQQEQ